MNHIKTPPPAEAVAAWEEYRQSLLDATPGAMSKNQVHNIERRRGAFLAGWLAAEERRDALDGPT